jgi:hypothetical protein
LPQYRIVEQYAADDAAITFKKRLQNESALVSRDRQIIACVRARIRGKKDQRDGVSLQLRRTPERQMS